MNHVSLGFVCAVSLTASLIATLMAGCGMPLEQYTEEIKGDSTQEKPSLPGEPSVPSGPSEGNGVSVITSYDLQAYVPVPAAGAVPVKVVESRLDLEAAVVWMDGDGTPIAEPFTAFVQGTVYQAEITLTAKGSYTFDPSMSFKYYPTDAVDVQPNDNIHVNSRVLTPVTYKTTAAPATIPQEMLDLAPYIPAPVTGVGPVTNFYAGTYGGTVAWTAGAMPHSGLFQASTVYTATVTLYPGPGYTLDGVTSVTYNNQTLTYDTGTKKTTIAFAATGNGGGMPVVSNLNLTNKVPTPLMGGKPGLTVSDLQYTGTVVWSPDHDPFQYGVTYVATVTLAAASGYTFTGVEKNAFSHGGSSSVINNVGSGEVTITFPPAAFSSTQHIASFSGSSAKPLDSAIDIIRAAKQISLSPQLYLFLDPGNEKVKLDTAEDLGTATYLMYGLELTSANSPSYVEIDGGGRTVDLTGKEKGYLISVWSGVTLALKNITLKGLKMGDPDDGNDNSWAVICVENGGALILKEGAVITANTNTNTAYYRGGGVFVEGGGLFTMEDGTISGNIAASGGGVSLGINSSGKFIMTSGTISDNKATQSVGGGGVLVGSGGTFTMEGGTISGNEAPNGGGVYSNKTFTMKGGTISGNTATTNGGGVMVAGGTFTKNGGGIIYGEKEQGKDTTTGKDLKNTATNGSAVFVSSDSKKRDDTAAAGDNLDSTTTGSTGGWEEP
jgi:hypothetical protein